MISEARGLSPGVGRSMAGNGSVNRSNRGAWGRKATTRRRRRTFFISTPGPSVRRTWRARVANREITGGSSRSEGKSPYLIQSVITLQNQNRARLIFGDGAVAPAKGVVARAYAAPPWDSA
jgi:hypothetical protein